MQQILQVFDVDAYEFCVKQTPAADIKNAAIEDFNAAVDHLSDGIDRRVGAVLLVHRLEHVHVLLLHETESDSFRLPGGKICEGESVEDCLHRTLRTDLAPHDFPEIVWRVQASLGSWWRPHISSKEMPLVMSQVTRPKEVSIMSHFNHDIQL